MTKLFIVFLTALFATLNAEDVVKAVLFPFREAIIASRVESTLQPYRFRIGELFKKDEIITTLDNADYTLKLNEKKNQLDFAQAVYQDKKELREKNFASGFELQKAEFEFRMAKNAFQEAELNLSRCLIKAPFSGKIVEILTKEYETVRPGQQLFRIIDDTSLLALMNVPLNKVSPAGAVVSLKLDNGKIVKGTVYEVAPQADHRSGTIRVRVLIKNQSGAIRPGMTGELINAK
jgi:RND family efflux transporter MFP subunit